MNRATTEVTTIHGNRLTAFDDDAITREIRREGVYDRWTLDSIIDILDCLAADVCLDVGANIGNHSIVMADHCKKLYSFEPIPFIFDVLEKNLQTRSDRAHAVQIALSDQATSASITVSAEGNLGKSTMLDGADGSKVTINTARGDDFLAMQDGNVDFIKIDVEGLEPQVIRGLQDTIRQHQPVILLEWNSSHTRRGFEEFGLWNTTLANYHSYSLTHRRSRQIAGRALRGSVHRLLIKLMGSNSWRLARFDVENDYPNVLLIPEKSKWLLSTLANASASDID